MISRRELGRIALWDYCPNGFRAACRGAGESACGYCLAERKRESGRPATGGKGGYRASHRGVRTIQSSAFPALYETLARFVGVAPEEVTVGAGSTEILQLCIGWPSPRLRVR